jgi:hypothetical protein
VVTGDDPLDVLADYEGAVIDAAAGDRVYVDAFRAALAAVRADRDRLREALREGWTLVENYPLSGQRGPHEQWDAFAKEAMRLLSPELSTALAQCSQGEPR